ncbi:Uncharacterised protein [Dermatophilus congolensis]|uniref:Uncharacterized protein n=1 Tax=Dermatophilus congolensis TaxID=1863 RepID=A0A239VPU3_9MICO|nr:Uncharacterised protein [Dermatophilus congolensis]
MGKISRSEQAISAILMAFIAIFLNDLQFARTTRDFLSIIFAFAVSFFITGAISYGYNWLSDRLSGDKKH